MIRLGASCAVFKDHNVLLVKRANEPMKGYWSLPGGRVEPGESPIVAARREMREETGLIVDRLRLVTFTRPYRSVKGKPVFANFTIHTFVAGIHSGTPSAADDAEALAWVDIDSQHSLSLTPNVETIIRMAKEIALTHS